MKISKIYLRICSLLFACILVCGSILRPVVTYASPYDLMIGSSSNAVSMFALPRSSVGTVTNTATGALVAVRYTNGTFNNASFITPTLVNDRWKFNFSIPDYLSGYWIDEVNFYFSSQASGFNVLPSPPGNYLFSMDFASDFSYSLNPDSRTRLFSVYGPANAELEYSNIFLDPLFASGDFYISPMAVDFRTGYNNVRVRIFPSRDSNMKNFGGSYSVSFKMTDIDGAGLVGSDLSYGDVVQDQMSGQLSDLSSSVDSMAEDLSSAAENLEYISTSQNLIIRGIDNVVMHISDQLFAFWNQLYNLIHVPTMAKMDDIISAINNMDLEIEVNLDGLKSTINNMSTAVQNKLQSVTNTITGGFDNSGIEQNGNELDSSITEFEEAEQNVLESVNDSLNDFEFDADLSEYKNIVQVISDFLQELYDSSGGFKLVINLSLMLSVASIVIGVYRFKEGG